MNVRIEARPMTLTASCVVAKVTVETILTDIIVSPVMSSFFLTPVISVGGNSISSITPETNLLGVRAAA